MSDFMTGTYNPLASQGYGFNDNSFSTSYVMPYQATSAGSGVTSVTDDLTGAVSNIFHSFTTGLSNAISLTAAGVGNYLSGAGQPQIVGYDRYNNAIYMVTDPRTGAQYTTSSPGYPGAPGSSSQYIERTPQSPNGTGLWGWITNTLSLPAPTPQQSIGTVPVGSPAASVVNVPGIGPVTIPQLILGAGALLAVAVIIKAAVK